ncbi:ExbD/TolR family protein [Aestuariivirga sp.]|jgi:biopolymer transport protein TolR|uniref:ExbD/TolR family protein n=1 Tax=Aestuariivirga sp. TaxID=2650926 RepID=UPI003784836C
MGASTGGARGGYQRRNARRRSSAGVISEINVTPLVDVMLVLLIVFMVAAPLMTVGVPIDLPKTDAKPLNSQVEPLSVSIKPDGSIFLMEEPMTMELLAQKLQVLYGVDPEKEIRVRGDLAASYGPIAEVLGAISSAGFKKIGLETLPGGGSTAVAPAPQLPTPEGQN